MSIRVIAGTAKGRRLKLVPGDSTRPIMDRVKESLFNIIGRAILDADFLDLFAGTGSVGIEALSRGARHALLTDLDPRAIRTISDNLKLTGFSDRATVRKQDALHAAQAGAGSEPMISSTSRRRSTRACGGRRCTRWTKIRAGCTRTAKRIVQIDPTEYTSRSRCDHLATQRRAALRQYALVVLPPRDADSGRISLVADMEKLEPVVRELIQLYSVTAPPIPIERMLSIPTLICGKKWIWTTSPRPF